MTRTEHLHWLAVGAVSAHDISGGVISGELRHQRADGSGDAQTQLRDIRVGQTVAFITAMCALAVTVAGVAVTSNGWWVTPAVTYFAAVAAAAVVLARHR